MGRIYHKSQFQFWSANQLAGAVDLQIFRRPDGALVAVVSERMDADGRQTEPGVSATDGIEQIATAVVTQLNFQFDYLIEYYPEHGQLLSLARSNSQKREVPEQFYLITLRWRDGTNGYQVDQSGRNWAWKRISRVAAEQIIGEPFSG